MLLGTETMQHEAATAHWPPHCTLHTDLIKETEHNMMQLVPMMDALQQAASSALLPSQPAMRSTR